jgi:hypothetical protein
MIAPKHNGDVSDDIAQKENPEPRRRTQILFLLIHRPDALSSGAFQLARRSSGIKNADEAALPVDTSVHNHVQDWTSRAQPCRRP